MKLNLNDFDKIIFDMDGVITKETSYWQAAALTCYDLLFDYTHYGKCGIDRTWCRNQYLEIYSTLFCNERTVRAVKRLGVNTNWDLAYVVFCVSKYIDPELTNLDEAHFKSVCMFIENIDMKAPEIFDALAELAAQAMPQYNKESLTRSAIWNELTTAFDIWYIGCDEFIGIREAEDLLFPTEDIENLLKTLSEKGIRIGVGTGRPLDEFEYPIKKAGLYKYFDPNLIVAFDDVSAAEQELKPKQPLAKPDPFVFLKAAFGENRSNKEIVDGDYTYEELSRTLIVGDAPSDLFAAQRGGFPFLAVLTGVEGKGAEQYFIDNKADYILDSILDMI